MDLNYWTKTFHFKIVKASPNSKLVWIIVKIRQEVVKILIFVFMPNLSTDLKASVVSLNFFERLIDFYQQHVF